MEKLGVINLELYGLSKCNEKFDEILTNIEGIMNRIINRNKVTFNNLPNEIYELILNYLKNKDAINFCFINKRTIEKVYDDYYWQRRNLKEFNTFSVRDSFRDYVLNVKDIDKNIEEYFQFANEAYDINSWIINYSKRYKDKTSYLIKVNDVCTYQNLQKLRDDVRFVMRALDLGKCWKCGKVMKEKSKQNHKC
jgi:hypothetical protein